MEKMISQKAVAVINTIKKATEKSVTGVSFVSIRNYANKSVFVRIKCIANKSGEVSNNLLNVGASYENAKKKDIEFLQKLNLHEHNFKSDLSLIEEARKELIASLIKPDENRSEGQINAYTNIVKGIKVHNETVGVLLNVKRGGKYFYPNAEKN